MYLPVVQTKTEWTFYPCIAQIITGLAGLLAIKLPVVSLFIDAHVSKYKNLSQSEFKVGCVISALCKLPWPKWFWLHQWQWLRLSI